MNRSVVEKQLAKLSSVLQENIKEANILFEEAQKHFNEDDLNQIRFAFECANDYHRGQMRKSGEPYIIHPISVALITIKEMLLLDKDSVIAALLHDAIEDTETTKGMLEELFNQDVANLVDGVSKIKDLNHMSKDEEEQMNNCKLLRTCASDIREIIIKIADRLHNMRTLIYKGTKEQISEYNALPDKDGIEDMIIHPNAKQIEKSAETYALFVPLADRIGASKVRDELLHISFMYLQNEAFHTTKQSLEKFKALNEQGITQYMLALSSLLEKAGVSHNLSISYQSLFNIYSALKKGKKKDANLSSIKGIVSYEINVDEKDECYQILALLKSKLKIVSIEDYIKTPKTNGYRAIHVYVETKEGYIACIKICTNKMKIINDYGIAALTKLYPNKKMQEIQAELIKNNAFVAALQSIERLSQDNATFLKQVEELLTKQIEVITKDNERISLPRGATVLDFAYKIHTDIGNQATNALLNGSLVSLDHLLDDNDIVTIITNIHQTHQPRHHANFVKTYTARKKIKEGANKADNLSRERRVPN